MEALFIISLVIYILDIIVLFYYGIHCFVMVRLFFKYRKNCVSDQGKLDALQKRMKTWPKVTIQHRASITPDPARAPTGPKCWYSRPDLAADPTGSPVAG